MDSLFGVGGGLVACALWAFSASRFQPLVHEHGPFSSNLFKTAIATGAFLLTWGFVALLGDPGIGHVDGWTMLALSGVTGMAFGDYALFAAVREVGVRQAMLIHGTAPLFLLLWALVGPGGGLAGLEVAGVLLLVGGVSIVTLDARGQGAFAGGSLVKGWIWGLIAAVGQAGGILLSSEALQSWSTIAGSSLRLSGALLGLLLVQVLRGRIRHSLKIFSLRAVYRQALIPSLLGTWMGILFMMLAIQKCTPAVAGAVLATTPIFVIYFAWQLLGERVTRGVMLGTVVAVIGVALVSVALGAA